MAMFQHELDNNIIVLSTKPAEEICKLMLDAFRRYNAHIVPNRSPRTHRRVGDPLLEHLDTEVHHIVFLFLSSSSVMVISQTHAPHPTSLIPPYPKNCVSFVRWIVLWQKTGLCFVRLDPYGDILIYTNHLISLVSSSIVCVIPSLNRTLRTSSGYAGNADQSSTCSLRPI